MADEVIARGIVQLVGDVSGLNGALALAKKMSSDGIGSIAKDLGNINIAAPLVAGVTAAAAGLATLTKLTANYADEINMASQKIGVNVEQLSALKYAADLNDVSFGSLQQSLSFFNKSLVKAGKGSADVAEELARTADEFSKMADGPAKTARAMELFGKSGRDMIPMLNLGAKGIRELTKEADAFGLVVDQGLAQKSDELNDNLDRMFAIAQGLGVTLGRELVPIAADLVGQFVEWYKVNGQLLQQDMAEAGRQIAAALSDIAGKATGIGDAMKHVVGAVGFLTKSFRVLWQVGELVIGAIMGKIGIMLVGISEAARQVALALNLDTVASGLDNLAHFGSALAEGWRNEWTEMEMLFEEFGAGMMRTEEKVTEKKKVEGEKRIGLTEDQLKREQEFAEKQAAAVAKLQDDFHKNTFKLRTDLNAEFEKGWKEYHEAIEKSSDEATKPYEDAFKNFLAFTEEVRGADFDARRKKLEEDAAAYLALFSGNAQMRKQIEEQLALDLRQLGDEEAKYRNEAWQRTTDTLKGMEADLYAARYAFGEKGFKVWKGIAITNTVIETIESAVAAYKSAANIPYVGWILAPAAAAAALAAGYARVREIKAQKFAPQAAGGADFVPEDQTILAHQGELIAPAEPAEKIRRFADNLEAGRGGGGPLDVTFRFEGNDRGVVTQLLRMLSYEVRDRGGELIASGLLGSARAA